MKTLLVILALFTAVSIGEAQPRRVLPRMVLDDYLEPNNVFRDAAAGLSFTYPKDWKVIGGEQGDLENETENVLYLQLPRRSRASALAFYQQYSTWAAGPGSTPVERYMRMVATEKARLRVAEGIKDYKNNPTSFVFSTAGNTATLKNSATFIQDRKEHTEYFIRILGPGGYVVFVMEGPSADVRAATPAFDQMAASAHGALIEADDVHKDSLDWFLRGK